MKLLSLPFHLKACLAGIALSIISPLSAEEPTALYRKENVTVAGKEYAYRLMTPDSPAAGKQYPLIIFLHGAGERGNDNQAHLKFLPTQMASPALRKSHPCFVLATQCEANKQWVDAPWGDKISKPMAAEPSEMMRCAIAAITKTLKDPGIDPKRVYLTGLSMGGYGSWELAMRHPDWFAAVAPICGGGDETQVAKIKSIPIWAFHGLDDTVVWPIRSQQLVDALKAIGGNVKYTALPKVGHGAWGPAYDMKSGLIDWLFAQKKP